MRISKVIVKKGVSGFLDFEMNNLGSTVIIAGENGSGKTRLLKLIEKTIRQNLCGTLNPDCLISYSDHKESQITTFSESNLHIINYSHSDLLLQSPKGFPPFVIEVSKCNLENPNCTFEDTAREALLYLTNLAKYSSESELELFNNTYCEPLLGTKLVINEGEIYPSLFNIKISDFDKKPLSPGQTYLLRLCVALNSSSASKETILFLDEPESHLHPKALLELLEKLQTRFSLGQIWIATHSVELLSRFWYSNIWYMLRKQIKDSNGNQEYASLIKHMGSKNGILLNNILGDEDKRFWLYQFVTATDAFACNAFAMECLHEPMIVARARENDPSTSLARAQLKEGDVVIDFGAGKGRFLSCYLNTKHHFEYYAYDKYGYATKDVTGKMLADICKEEMNKYNIDAKTHYFGNEDEFKELPVANKILMINVLHEIAPTEWVLMFNQISEKLSDDGFLIVIERKELTIGEKPFDSDFFVVQRESMAKLLMCDSTSFGYIEHEERPVIAYLIPKELLSGINNNTVEDSIIAIKEIAKAQIKRIKQNRPSKEMSSNPNQQIELWECGVSLAFWTHQFANASLFLDVK